MSDKLYYSYIVYVSNLHVHLYPHIMHKYIYMHNIPPNICISAIINY